MLVGVVCSQSVPHVSEIFGQTLRLYLTRKSRVLAVGKTSKRKVISRCIDGVPGVSGRVEVHLLQFRARVSDRELSSSSVDNPQIERE